MSRLPFELALALRYLRPKGTPVSIITLICVLGVMLGVAILIIVISVMTGFGDLLRSKVLGLNSHIKIQQFRGPLGEWRSLVEQVEAQSRVADSSSSAVLVRSTRACPAWADVGHYGEP